LKWLKKTCHWLNKQPRLIRYTNEYSKNIVAGKTEIEFAESITLPEMSELIEVDLNIEKSE